jgi:ankyrin repeat protein
MLLEICSQPTDDDIRRILEKPPTTLTELYCLVLSRIAAVGRSKEAIDCFKFVAIAKRPLTVHELQEAMAVEPYAKASEPGRFINNFSQIFTWFGGLVIREEINDEIRFAHSTILQAILDRRIVSSQPWAHIDLQQADKDVGVICTTYLHFDDFQTQLVKRSGLQVINSKTILNASLRGMMPLLANVLQSMPSQRTPRPEISPGVAQKLVDATTSGANVSGVANPGVGHHPFLEYASLHWLSHSRHFSTLDRIWPLWKALLSDDHRLAKKPIGLTQNSLVLKKEIIREWHFALFQWDQLGQKSLRPYDLARIVMDARRASATAFMASLFHHCVRFAPDEAFRILNTMIKEGDRDLAGAIIDSSMGDTTVNLWSNPATHERPELRNYYTIILFSAAVSDDTDLIKRLAACDVDVNRQISWEIPNLHDDWTALSVAAFAGNLAAAKILIELGATVNTNASVARNAIRAAAGNGHAAVVELLFSSGGNINATAQGSADRTILQAAAESGHSEIVAQLLSWGADVNAAPAVSYGRTALQAAAEMGQAEIVTKLLSAGADINAAPAERHGRTALQAAARNGHVRIVAQLLSMGADVNAASAEFFGRTALQDAAEAGHTEIVAKLLSAGADVNATPAVEIGFTAPQGAAGRGHAEIVNKLLSAGADVNVAPARELREFGCTALQAARAGGFEEIVTMLLAAGAREKKR